MFSNDSSDMLDEEGAYYAPKRLSLIASVSKAVSWLVLLVYLLGVIFSVYTIVGETQSGAFHPDPYTYISIVATLITGVVYFLLLQAFAIGINVLMEIEFNIRARKGASS